MSLAFACEAMLVRRAAGFSEAVCLGLLLPLDFRMYASRTSNLTKLNNKQVIIKYMTERE